MRDWINCSSCDEEYQVIGGSLGALPLYCAFCGIDVENEESEDEIEFEEEE